MILLNTDSLRGNRSESVIQQINVIILQKIKR